MSVVIFGISVLCWCFYPTCIIKLYYQLTSCFQSFAVPGNTLNATFTNLSPSTLYRLQVTGNLKGKASDPGQTEGVTSNSNSMKCWHCVVWYIYTVLAPIRI